MNVDHLQPSPQLQRVGVIGDVHSEDGALETALDYLRDHGDVEIVFCVGDVVTGHGDAGRCCDLLRSRGVVTVRGNHDRWFLTGKGSRGGYERIPFATPAEKVPADGRAFLSALPTTAAYDTPRGAMLLCHGLGEEDTATVYPDDPDRALAGNHHLHAVTDGGRHRFLVGGHNHRRMVRHFRSLTLVTAGTLKRAEGAGFLIADFAAGHAHFFDIAPYSRKVTAAETALL